MPSGNSSEQDLGKRSKKNNQDEELATPLCDKCGNAKIKEADEWVCPHCQGEIDFLGDDDE